MRIAQPVRIGIWTLILLNIVMSVVSIWALLRISPAIEQILDRNDRSIQACETMISSLALIHNTETTNDSLLNQFKSALSTASDNITEQGEKETLALISKWYPLAFSNDTTEPYRLTIAAINQLSSINRKAMIDGENEARRISFAGGWIIVAMGIFQFIAGMLLTRSLSRNTIEPMEEILAVIMSQKRGDRQRRCSLGDYPTDIRLLFVEINAFLDKNSRSSDLTDLFGDSFNKWD